ncbi:MAG: molecular chaperone HtpG [Simkania sp.]|nr:molecular chaperone HtpG [Simkania sp.]
MTQGKLTIHTENILPIIKKWLYSDKEIFLRELISNACDALQKLKILRETEQAPAIKDELRIDVTIDAKKKTLTIADTGIGMTADEVVKYIAQVAFSGAEEFLGKYQSSSNKEEIIGHFGLGFYSAYMVSSQVEIDTLSYQSESEPALWCCDGSIDYTLEKGLRTDRGTAITLHIDAESEEYLNEGKIRDILMRYCAFLPFPIHLNGTHINHEEPLWVKPSSTLTDQDYLQFYRTLYPLEPDPVFWIHLNVDYPFHLKGILYFPKIQRRFEWDKSAMKLFCNRVFVSDNCKDLLPDFLMILRGAIDSPDIPLNVSRSYLQMDRTVRQLSTHMTKKVADRLSSLFSSDREKFIAVWPDLEMIVKLGMLHDEKFYERAKEFLIWKTLNGEWLTLDEYKNRQPDNAKDKVFYTAEEKLSTALIDLYHKQGIGVLLTNAHIDTALMNSIESKSHPVQFQRIDGKLGDHLLDTSREKTLLDNSGKTESARIADFFRAHLGQKDQLEIEAKSLATDTLPAFLIVDEDTRRLRDYLALSGQPLPSGLTSKRTLVLNTNNKLVSAIYHLKDKKPELAKEMSSHLYELSLLAQKELDPAALSGFIERNTRVLEQLTSD